MKTQNQINAALEKVENALEELRNMIVVKEVSARSLAARNKKMIPKAERAYLKAGIEAILKQSKDGVKVRELTKLTGRRHYNVRRIIMQIPNVQTKGKGPTMIYFLA